MDLKKFELGADLLKKVAGGIADAGIDPMAFIEERLATQRPLTAEEKEKLKGFAKTFAWKNAKEYLSKQGYSAGLLDNIFCEILR